jgi:hypothetical protein
MSERPVYRHWRLEHQVRTTTPQHNGSFTNTQQSSRECSTVSAPICMPWDALDNPAVRSVSLTDAMPPSGDCAITHQTTACLPSRLAGAPPGLRHIACPPNRLVLKFTDHPLNISSPLVAPLSRIDELRGATNISPQQGTLVVAEQMTSRPCEWDGSARQSVQDTCTTRGSSEEPELAQEAYSRHDLNIRASPTLQTSTTTLPGPHGCQSREPPAQPEWDMRALHTNSARNRGLGRAGEAGSSTQGSWHSSSCGASLTHSRSCSTSAYTGLPLGVPRPMDSFLPMPPPMSAEGVLQVDVSSSESDVFHDGSPHSMGPRAC